MFSFDTGLETLPRAIADKLGDSVRLSEGVDLLRKTDSGWEVITAKGSEEHSAVLLATGAHQLARIRVEADDFPSLEPLSEVIYPPVASVTLGFRRLDVKAALDGFGVLVPQAEGLNILGTLFTSTLFPNRAPDRHVTLTSYIGGARAPHLASRGKDEIIDLVLADLCKLVGVSGTPTFEHFCVFPEAIPQYNVGYGKFKQLMTNAESAAPGLFIAGQARCGISLSDSILSGHKAAERIENHLSRFDLHLAEERLAHFQTT
jgi:oxygen-dependent protoporphyrinogen oxidase